MGACKERTKKEIIINPVVQGYIRLCCGTGYSEYPGFSCPVCSRIYWGVSGKCDSVKESQPEPGVDRHNLKGKP